MVLRIKVDEIQEAGLDFREVLPRAALGRILEGEAGERPTGFQATGDAGLRVRFERVNERDIVARGGFEVALRTDCRRCLGAVELRLPVDFELDFVDAERVPVFSAGEREDDGEGEVAGTFGPDEADQVPYSGKELDLAPIVREQLLLALPMDALCAEDCKGLCQVCGANLNEAACGCDRHVPDPRWAALKNIKLS